MYYNNYEFLYNEDGIFFLEDNSSDPYFNEEFYQLNSDLNKAVEEVFIEHVEVFNEAVALTEKNYIEASDNFMKELERRFIQLRASINQDNLDTVKKKLINFNKTLENKISKLQKHINGNEWDKAVRMSISNELLTKLLTGLIISIPTSLVKGYLGSRKRTQKKLENKIGKKYNAEVEYIKNKNPFKDNVRIRDFDRGNRKIIRKKVDKIMDKRTNDLMDSAVLGTYTAILTGIGITSSLVKFATSKKICQLPSVQSQVEKFLQFLINLNNRTKDLIK